MPTILILADVPGWIIDHIVDALIRGLQHRYTFVKAHYATLTAEELIALCEATQPQLLHYGNWGEVDKHVPAILHAKNRRIARLLSVQSHRYPANLVQHIPLFSALHVANPDLATAFAPFHHDVTYIPDGVDAPFFQQPFTAGFAGRPDGYKGYDMIVEACHLAGVEFLPATTIPRDAMLAYYRALDVLICASEAEGYGMPVMEALAMNVPVISTRVGVAWMLLRDSGLPLTFVDRSAKAIAEALTTMTARRAALEPFTWPRVCAQFQDLYDRLFQRP